MHIITGC